MRCTTLLALSAPIGVRQLVKSLVTRVAAARTDKKRKGSFAPLKRGDDDYLKPHGTPSVYKRMGIHSNCGGNLDCIRFHGGNHLLFGRSLLSEAVGWVAPMWKVGSPLL